MITLSNLPKIILQHKKRVGRGEGSNRGKNSGKGHKGQKKHGQGVRIGFEGGQKSLIRRSPKLRGFKPMDRKNLTTLLLSQIDKNYDLGETVSLQTLQEKGIVSKFIKKVRIIKSGSLDKKLSFSSEDSLYLTKGVKSLVS